MKQSHAQVRLILSVDTVCSRRDLFSVFVCVFVLGLITVCVRLATSRDVVLLALKNCRARFSNVCFHEHGGFTIEWCSTVVGYRKQLQNPYLLK